MSNRWLTVTNLANRKAELSLRGVIGIPKAWENYGANAAGTAKDFEKELKALGSDIEEITLRIYSPGGYVFDALAIHDILASHPARITAQVDGLAASAATVIMLAADKRVMPSNAWLMIHNAQGIEAGDYRAMAKMATDLEKWSADIAKMYAGTIKGGKGAATKKTLTELRAMMDAETWLTGTDAKELGLVDEVTNEVVLSNCIAPLDLALRLPVNLDRVPAAVRAAFDTAAPTSSASAPPPPEDPSMKLHRTPLLNAATETPPAGGGAAPVPPAPQPTAQTPPAAQPPPAATPPAGITLADVTNAVTEALKPLGERITALEGLRAAGVSPTAWGAQPPTPQPSANIDAPKTADDARELLKKAKNFEEKRQILAAAEKAGIRL